jgi:GT2 family glycosyltransferase
MSRAAGRPGKVSVAIVSWNGRHHLETCLEALRGQEDPGIPWEVLVLDNGSTDGTSAWLSRHHPWVRLVASPANLGFAAGNNRLVELAAGDAVALLNNDTRPRPGWLSALVEALAAAPPDVAAISGLILDWEGRRLDFARGILTFDGHAFQLGFRRPLAEVELPAPGTELPFPCGGNVLLRRESFRAAGGFDADYFAYLEDVDLGWRLWAGGERVVFAPEAVVHHRSAGTSDLLGLFNRGFLFERNAFLTAYKNYEAGLWERMMPAVMLTLLARTQALLAGNNPGGELLRVDPYAGSIAGTGRRAESGKAAGASPRAFAEPATGDRLLAELRGKWSRLGPREFLRRGLHKAIDRLLGGSGESGRAAGGPSVEAPAVKLADPRTISQLRALSYVLSHLDRAAAKRELVQARRRRSDRDYFERFPLHVVPTYPGDEELLAGAGFNAWLPTDLQFIRRGLCEVMEVG